MTSFLSYFVVIAIGNKYMNTSSGISLVRLLKRGLQSPVRCLLPEIRARSWVPDSNDLIKWALRLFCLTYMKKIKAPWKCVTVYFIIIKASITHWFLCLMVYGCLSNLVIGLENELTKSLWRQRKQWEKNSLIPSIFTLGKYSVGEWQAR